jgi:asparagine synthase (glutamine-hydrolysing)
MCGIAGLVDFEKPIAPGTLEAMLRLIVHRGPDDEGRYEKGPFAIGMRRLSIIDLAGGHQPLANEDETVWVVFNGEIYNYMELRAELETRGHVFRTNCDTEVIVHLYEDFGPCFPEYLNGMFGIALWDTRRQRVVLARDHLGIKPVFWHYRDGRLAFGSEMKCILASGCPPCTINKGALATYLHLGYIPRGQTAFSEITQLPPGHILTLEMGRPPALCAYWRLADAFHANAEMDEQSAAARALALLDDAVRLQLRSDVPLGVFLSGGIDSSAVSALAARHVHRIDTFGVGFTGHYFDETPYAREVARYIGSEHHEIIVEPQTLLDHLDLLTWHIEGPNADPAMLPSYIVCRHARSAVKVALSGNGGDEVFGGYFRHFDPPPHNTPACWLRSVLPKASRRVLAAVLQGGGDGRPQRALRRLLASNNAIGLAYWVDQAPSAVREAVTPWSNESFQATEWVETVIAEIQGDWVNRRLYYDSTTYMPDQILAMVDRSSMAVSLEVRVPFLDRRLVEFMASLAGRQKVAKGAGKLVLRRALRDLLPQSIFERRKLGFGLPVVRWIQSPQLTERLQGMLTGRLASDGYVEARALRREIDSPDKAARHAAFLWNLLMLELWYGQFGRGHLTP